MKKKRFLPRIFSLLTFFYWYFLNIVQFTCSYNNIPSYPTTFGPQQQHNCPIHGNSALKKLGLSGEIFFIMPNSNPLLLKPSTRGNLYYQLRCDDFHHDVFDEPGSISFLTTSQNNFTASLGINTFTNLFNITSDSNTTVVNQAICQSSLSRLFSPQFTQTGLDRLLKPSKSNNQPPPDESEEVTGDLQPGYSNCPHHGPHPKPPKPIPIHDSKTEQTHPKPPERPETHTDTAPKVDNDAGKNSIEIDLSRNPYLSYRVDDNPTNPPKKKPHDCIDDHPILTASTKELVQFLPELKWPIPDWFEQLWEEYKKTTDARSFLENITNKAFNCNGLDCIQMLSGFGAFLKTFNQCQWYYHSTGKDGIKSPHLFNSVRIPPKFTLYSGDNHRLILSFTDLIDYPVEEKVPNPIQPDLPQLDPPPESTPSTPSTPSHSTPNPTLVGNIGPVKPIQPETIVPTQHTTSSTVMVPQQPIIPHYYPQYRPTYRSQLVSWRRQPTQTQLTYYPYYYNYYYYFYYY
jgi:hypothetical protein